MNGEFTPVTPKTNWTPWIVSGIILIVLSCCCLGLATTAYVFWPTAEAPAQPAEAEAPVVTFATPCDGWNTAAGATNILPPGSTARGDIVADGIAYYDKGGFGQGTSVINLSSENVTIFAEWGAGCEVSTDLKFMVNKDLSDGCGSICREARIITITDAGITDKIYTQPIK